MGTYGNFIGNKTILDMLIGMVWVIDKQSLLIDVYLPPHQIFYRLQFKVDIYKHR